MRSFLILLIFDKIFLSKRNNSHNEVDKSHVKKIRVDKNKDLNAGKVEQIEEMILSDGLMTSNTSKNQVELLHNDFFEAPELDLGFDDIAEKIREYKCRALSLDSVSRLNACIVQDCEMLEEGAVNSYIFVKADQQVVEKYYSPDPIQLGLYTANLFFNSIAFEDLLKVLNDTLTFESPCEHVDKASMEPYLKDITGPDLIYTDYNVAKEAVKILKSKGLKKDLASQNIAKLFIFASRQDIKFCKSAVVQVVKLLKERRKYFKLEDEFRMRGNLTLIYLNPRNSNADLDQFSGIYTSLNTKIVSVLISVIYAIRTGVLPFGFDE